MEVEKQQESSPDEFNSVQEIKSYVSNDTSEPSSNEKDVEAGLDKGVIEAEPKPVPGPRATSGPKGPGGGRSLPSSHPMHPSQFIGDKYAQPAMITLLGCFCVMVSIFYPP